MKKRVFSICLFFIAILSVVAISFCIYEHNIHSNSTRNPVTEVFVFEKSFQRYLPL